VDAAIGIGQGGSDKDFSFGHDRGRETLNRKGIVANHHLPAELGKISASG
jgi:hypothetical protein